MKIESNWNSSLCRKFVVLIVENKLIIDNTYVK